MKIIGITGSIGSGKSTVSNYLKKQGFAIIDADKIAKNILDTNEDIKKELVESFGEMIASKNDDGKIGINKELLRAIAFATPESKVKLDEITHKYILDYINLKIEEFRDKNKATVFLDAPLLFETGLDKKCDDVWVVFTKKRTKIERVTERDGVSVENIENILKTQMSYQKQVQLATYILDNNHKKEHLYMQIDKILETSNIKLEPRKISKGRSIKIVKK